MPVKQLKTVSLIIYCSSNQCEHAPVTIYEDNQGTIARQKILYVVKGVNTLILDITLFDLHLVMEE